MEEPRKTTSGESRRASGEDAFSELLEDYLSTREDHNYRKAHGYSCAETRGRLTALAERMDSMVPR